MERYSEDCLAFFKKLIQTPSVNDKENEKDVANLLVNEAEKLDLPYRVIEKEPGRPNVFIGDNFDESTGLLLVSHMDTVPVGDETKWKHGPFNAEVVDGKLYGRGALDCKGGLAISLYAMKALKDQGKPDYVKILAGADEETGADSLFGIRAVLEEGLKARGAVYTYGGELENEITIGHRGVVRVWVHCHGEATHSGSIDWQTRKKGASAIAGLQEFLNRLQDIRYSNEHEYFHKLKTTITPTMIRGGEGESLVPAEAKVLLDIRTLPGDNEKVLKQLEELVDSLNSEGLSFDLKIKNNIPAALTDPNSELVQETIKLKGKHHGHGNPVLKASGPANESYMLIGSGIPTIAGFGAVGEGYHSLNEYAEVESIAPAIQFLMDLAEGIHS